MAYTATASLDSDSARPIGRGLGMLSGTVTISSYNQTGAAITSITGQFNTIQRVLLDGANNKSSEAVFGTWDTSVGCVNLYNVTLDNSKYTYTELANSTASCGTWDFIAIGRLKGKAG